MESPDYLPLYNTFYLGNMRKKLGLLRKEEPEDEMLITELLQTMHNTGTDFTNTFRCLSQIPFPTSGDEEAEEGVIKMATDLFLEQCASLEELKAANKPSMDTRHRSPFSELTMLLHLAQSNPSLFQMVSERRTVSMKLGWPKELLEVEAKHRENWVTSYSKRLAGEVEGQRDVQALQEERVKVMNGTNPQYVLRNYIAQNARGSRERRLL